MIVFFEGDKFICVIALLSIVFIFIRKQNLKSRRIDRWIFLYTCVYVPIYEELFFRYVVRRFLGSPIITAFIFGCCHIINYTYNRNMKVIITQMVIAFFAGLIYQFSLTLEMAIFCHIFYNFSSEMIMQILSKN